MFVFVFLLTISGHWNKVIIIINELLYFHFGVGNFMFKIYFRLRAIFYIGSQARAKISWIESLYKQNIIQRSCKLIDRRFIRIQSDKEIERNKWTKKSTTNLNVRGISFPINWIIICFSNLKLICLECCGFFSFLSNIYVLN